MSHSLDGLHPGPELSGMLRPVQTPNTVDADVFPPLRAQTTEPSIFLPYVTEDIAFEEEYEEYLRWSDSHSNASSQASSAWARLPELVHDIADSISDSESIVSMGELNDDTRLDVGKEARDVPDENVNNWEVSVVFALRVVGLPTVTSVAEWTRTAHEPQNYGCAHKVACAPAVELWVWQPPACLAVRARRGHGDRRRGRRGGAWADAEGAFWAVPIRRGSGRSRVCVWVSTFYSFGSA